MQYYPMLAQIGSKKDIKQKGYIFEPKLDGIRALCYVNDDLIFFSRNSLNLTNRFPEFDFRKNIIATSCILDGEIVVYDSQGNPSFELLQQGNITATFVVFDILKKNGKLLLEKPLDERKKILEATIEPTQHLEIIYFTKQGNLLWDIITQRGIEGLLAKEEKSYYLPGKRSKAWLKIKTIKTVDCVIVGYAKNKRILSSLALGLYDKQKNLVYIGNVGTGFTESLIDELHTKLEKIRTLIPTVINPHKDILWVKPHLVCEITYRSVTHKAMLRHAVFMRLRKDKKPKDCTIADQLTSEEQKTFSFGT